MELEDVDLATQHNGGESHSLTQKPGVETRLEILNLRRKLGGEGKNQIYRRAGNIFGYKFYGVRGCRFGSST